MKNRKKKLLTFNLNCLENHRRNKEVAITFVTNQKSFNNYIEHLLEVVFNI